MNRPRTGRLAAVLAAALHSWATATTDPSTPVARLVIRKAPVWEHIGTTPLTDRQVTRILGILRDDLVPDQPATPIQVAATLDQFLAEWRAEGKKVIRPADLIAALPRLACTTAELAAQILRLVDSRYIRETRRPGTYRL